MAGELEEKRLVAGPKVRDPFLESRIADEGCQILSLKPVDDKRQLKLCIG
jgi:hypothetical protein